MLNTGRLVEGGRVVISIVSNGLTLVAFKHLFLDKKKKFLQREVPSVHI